MNISISPFSGLAGRMQFQLVLYFEEVSHRFKNHYEKSIQELHEKYIAGNKQISDELDKQKKISETEDECGYCCLNCDEIERQKCIALERNGLAYQADAAGVHKDFADQYRLSSANSRWTVHPSVLPEEKVSNWVIKKASKQGRAPCQLGPASHWKRPGSWRQQV